MLLPVALETTMHLTHLFIPTLAAWPCTPLPPSGLASQSRDLPHSPLSPLSTSHDSSKLLLNESNEKLFSGRKRLRSTCRNSFTPSPNPGFSPLEALSPTYFWMVSPECQNSSPCTSGRIPIPDPQANLSRHYILVTCGGGSNEKHIF